MYYGGYAKLALHTSVIFATALLFPPGASMLLIGAGTILAYAVRRQTVDEAAFNTAQTMLQAGLASGILALAGWSHLRFDPNVPHLLWAVPPAAAAMYAVGTLSVATAVGLQSERSPLKVWREIASFDIVEMLAQLVLGFLAALIAAREPWALPLLLVPAAAIYRSSERHVRLRERTQELAHQAHHDPLTGLPNRSLFTSRLEQALARPAGCVAVLFVDLDRFKFVNDSLGHDAGDEVLKAIAVRLRESLRPADTVSRHGGDEFTILLEDIADADHAARVADRIGRQLAAPFETDGHSAYVTASIGIVTGTTGRDTADGLLRAADAAMYRAKSSGKARYEIFDRAMGAAALERLDLEAGLRRAVEKGEFELYYQPQVVLGSRAITGIEALVRWRHPPAG